MTPRSIRRLVYRLERRDDPVSQGILRLALFAYSAWDGLVLQRSARPDLGSEKLVVPQHKLLYVGVPKVATRSMITALRALGQTREPVFSERDIETLMTGNPGLSDYFKFTIVRNPFSRAVSCFQNKIEDLTPVKKARILNHRPGLEPGMTFDAFAEWLNTPAGSDDFADRHWMSQYRITALDRPDVIEYDLVGRFEHLTRDYTTLARRTGLSLPSLPHKHQSGAGSDYRKYYTDRSRDLIARRYETDLRLLEYSFSDVDELPT